MKKFVRKLNATILSMILITSTTHIFASEVNLTEDQELNFNQATITNEVDNSNIEYNNVDGLSFDVTFDIDKIESFVSEQNSLEEVEIIEFEDLEQESFDLFEKENEQNAIKKSSVEAIESEIQNQIIDENQSSGIATFSVTENTNPNNAYFLPLNQSGYGTITTQGEQRWCVTQITQRSKMTTTLNMNANSDFDLVIFKLNESNMTLDFVAESCLNMGETEFIDIIAEPGIYYFAVVSYAGTGIFELTAYTSAYDLQYEINDNMSKATNVSDNNFTINAVIDNPYDYDYYKFNITGTRASEFTLNNPQNKNYNMFLILNGNSVYSITSGLKYDVPAGTHYIAVLSNDGQYDINSPYTLKLTSETQLKTYVETSDGRNYFQMTNDGKQCYVNGNLIDFNWSYINYVNNSAGFINTYMDLIPRSNQKVAIYESHLSAINQDGELPYFASYTTNFEGARNVSPALILTLIDTKFNVDRYAGGEYSSESVHYWVPYTQVVIEPSTGKIIDVMAYNFYYYFGYRGYAVSRLPNNVTNIYNYDRVQ